MHRVQRYWQKGKNLDNLLEKLKLDTLYMYIICMSYIYPQEVLCVCFVCSTWIYKNFVCVYFVCLTRIYKKFVCVYFAWAFFLNLTWIDKNFVCIYFSCAFSVRVSTRSFMYLFRMSFLHEYFCVPYIYLLNLCMHLLCMWYYKNFVSEVCIYFYPWNSHMHSLEVWNEL